MNRRDRSADHEWCDRMAERNMRAARIAQLRKGPRYARPMDYIVAMLAAAFVVTPVCGLIVYLVTR